MNVLARLHDLTLRAGHASAPTHQHTVERDFTDCKRSDSQEIVCFDSGRRQLRHGDLDGDRDGVRVVCGIGCGDDHRIGAICRSGLEC